MPIVAKASALVVDLEDESIDPTQTTLRFVIDENEVEFGFNRALQSGIEMENLGNGDVATLLSIFADGTGDGPQDDVYAGLIPQQQGANAYIVVQQGDGLEAPQNRDTVEQYYDRLGFEQLTVDFSTEQPLNTAFGQGQSATFTSFDGVVSLGEIGADVVEQRAQFIALLYEAGLDRDGNIDEGGLNFWIDAAGDGLTNGQLANAFIESAEFEASFGAPDSLSDDAFVRQLYRNVLEREADADGFDFWSGVLEDNGGRRDDLLIAFAASSENRDGTPIVNTLEETDPGIWEFG